MEKVQKRKKVSVKKLFGKNKSNRPRPKHILDDFYSSSSDDEIFVSDSSDDNFLSDKPTSDEDEPHLSDLNQPGTSGVSKRIEKLQKDNYVAACYDKQWYIAQVLDSTDIIDEKGVAIYCSLKFTEIKGDNKFLWPSRDGHIIQVPSKEICVWCHLQSQ